LKLNNKQTPTCILCKSTNLKKHHYKPNLFNGRLFYYFLCNDCNSLSIHPLPTAEDFSKMYGVIDHTYFAEAKSDDSLLEFKYKSLKKYTHHKYEIDYFNKLIKSFKITSLLDFACGSGFYMQNAINHNIECVGIEFDKEFSEVIRKKTNLKVYETKDFISKYKGQKFDLIHIGHNLEHLLSPAETIKFLKTYAHESTLLVIDGPLEYNFCLSRMVIEFISNFSSNKPNNHSPQHLSFTTYKSQLSFLSSCNVNTVKYCVDEQYFPLPNQVDYKSMMSIFMYSLAKISINVSKLFKKQGNVFHYIGRYN